MKKSLQILKAILVLSLFIYPQKNSAQTTKSKRKDDAAVNLSRNRVERNDDIGNKRNKKVNNKLRVSQVDTSISNKVNKMLPDWSHETKKAVAFMFQKYGLPTDVSDQSLTWYNNGIWKKTTVYKNPLSLSKPHAHIGMFEQVFAFGKHAFISVEKIDENAKTDTLTGEITLLNESEELNYLTLNLVADIVSQRKTVQEAQNQYSGMFSQVKSGNNKITPENILAYMNAQQVEADEEKAATDEQDEELESLSQRRNKELDKEEKK